MQNPTIKNLRLRRRKDGMYEVVWTEDGTQKRRSTGHKRQADANAEMTRIEADVRAPRVPDAPTVGWIIDMFLETKQRSMKHHNHKTLSVSLNAVKTRLGNLRWDQLAQRHVDEYSHARMQDIAWGDNPAKTMARTISPSTVNRELRMLRTAINAAHAARYIPSPVAFRINVTPAPPKEVWLTRDEVRQLLAACEPQRDRDAEGRVTYRKRNRQHLYLFILLSIASAARKEAILTLTWDQIHFAEGAELNGQKLVDIKTRKVAGNSYIDFGEGTGNKRRPKMPIGDNFQLLWALYMARPADFGNADDERDTSQNRVITYKGKPVADIKAGLSNLVRECGIDKPVTPHTFKHSSITWMVQAGIPLSTISDLTKTSEKILRRVYSHHRPDYQAELGAALAI